MDNGSLSLIGKIKNMISPDQIVPTLIFLVTLVVIYIFFKILYKVFMKVTDAKLDSKLRLVSGKVIKYSGYVVIVLTIFSKLGINFSAVLGAAGIAGIAIGFAAQTSISNIISGLFLISEKSINIGDYISVDSGTAGTVKSIDPDTQAASNGELFFTVVTDIDTNTLKDRKGIEYPVKVGLEVDARLILESRTILYFLLKKVGVMV